MHDVSININQSFPDKLCTIWFVYGDLSGYQKILYYRHVPYK